MTREWKPGDVAMVTCRDGVERIAMLTDRRDLEALWICERDDWGRESEMSARPLVVIDPAADHDPAVVEITQRVGKALDMMPGTDLSHIRAAVNAALREFANPTPPKCSSRVEAMGGWVDCAKERGHVDWHMDSAQALSWRGGDQ